MDAVRTWLGDLAVGVADIQGQIAAEEAKLVTQIAAAMWKPR